MEPASIDKASCKTEAPIVHNAKRMRRCRLKKLRGFIRASTGGVSGFGWFVAGFAAANALFFSECSFIRNWLQDVINGSIIAAIVIQVGVLIYAVLQEMVRKREAYITNAAGSEATTDK